jgi:hypothetical protein
LLSLYLCLVDVLNLAVIYSPVIALILANVLELVVVLNLVIKLVFNSLYNIFSIRVLVVVLGCYVVIDVVALFVYLSL